jgi:teichuronic acid biosynthesis glycosyltransferase TuaG
MPRVSIIIPAYNAAELLPETLDSVVAQTLGDWEVIVADDASGDDTA